MKKAVMILLALLMLAGCQGLNGAEKKLKSGMYILKSDSMGSYVWFDTEQKIWRIGPGMMYSFGIGGVYEVSGRHITARDQNGEEVYLKLTVVSEDEIRLDSIGQPLLSAEIEWMKAGDVFVYYLFNGDSD
ncbi:MAG: hypothetical protein J5694_02395 [Erysipelotrichaceae bacterium]|nr:hypothetical protein [Erysipelotrichaceae bacterium]